MDSYLCETCKTIDFPGLFGVTRTRRRQYWQSLPDFLRLGYLDEIAEKRFCPFCRLIVRIALFDQLGDASIFIVNGTRVSCELERSEHGELVWASRDRRRLYRLALRLSPPLLSVPTHRIQILNDAITPEQLRTWALAHGQGPKPVYSTVELDEWQAPTIRTSEVDGLFKGRLMKPDYRADLNLIEGWYERCAQSSVHTGACSIHPHDAPRSRILAKGGFELPEVFRLIDVHCLKIVSARPDCRYIALSYRWPEERSKMLELNSDTKALLFETNGLVTQGKPLPKTIMDAIKVCKAMKQQFLWVDALCIIQDDTEDLAKNVSSMHSIYAFAELTIVAAYGDANSGLSGVSQDRPKHSQQYVERVAGLRLVTTHSDLDEVLSTCDWNTRGWTFQEKNLSGRLLFFGQHQMFFRCRKEYFCEDTIYEHNWELYSIYQNRRGVINSHHTTSIDSNWMSHIHDQGFNIYTRWASEYSARQLSYATDVSNAFTGMVNMLRASRSLDQYWLWGLPQNKMLSALLWMPVIDQQQVFQRRRQPCDYSCGISSYQAYEEGKGSRLLPPSWSWMGWIGAIEYPAAISEPLEYYGVTTPDFHWHILPSGGQACLTFTAYVQALFISSNAEPMEGSKQFATYTVTDSNDATESTEVSKIILDRTWADSIENRCFEFILLAHISSTLGGDNASEAEELTKVTKHKYRSMMIQLVTKDNEKIVAERVGLTVTPLDVWKRRLAHGQAKKMRIVLI